MATNLSAEKRQRQNQKRRLRNRIIRSTVRSEIKKLKLAVKKTDTQTAQELLKSVNRKIDKAASKGVYHRNNAARKKSRLHHLVNARA